MLRNCLVAAGISVAFFPAAASAQDHRHASTGFRVEALTGYENAAFDSVSDANGLLYGVGVGYDFAVKRLRFGLEGEVTDSTARKRLYFFNANNTFLGQVSLQSSRDLYVGARFGGEVARGILLYGKAGYSNFRESNAYSPSVGGTVTHPRFDGFRIGAGAEFALGRRTFVKTEYRFTNYERSQGFNRHQTVIGFGIRF
jgi:outer membrane immunogenic protein